MAQRHWLGILKSLPIEEPRFDAPRLHELFSDLNITWPGELEGISRVSSCIHLPFPCAGDAGSFCRPTLEKMSSLEDLVRTNQIQLRGCDVQRSRLGIHGPTTYLSLYMPCRSVTLPEPLLNPSLLPHAKADLEGLWLNGQSRRVGIALEGPRQDRSLRRVRGGQHLEGHEYADERDVHLPVRQMRARTHARARPKGIVLRARSVGQIEKSLWVELVGRLEMVRVKVRRPGVLVDIKTRQHNMETQGDEHHHCTYHKECGPSRDGRTLPQDVFDADAWQTHGQDGPEAQYLLAKGFHKVALLVL